MHNNKVTLGYHLLTIPEKVSAFLSCRMKNPWGMMVKPLSSTATICSTVQSLVEVRIHQSRPQFTVIHTYLGPYSPLLYACKDVYDNCDIAMQRTCTRNGFGIANYGPVKLVALRNNTIMKQRRWKKIKARQISNHLLKVRESCAVCITYCILSG